ncbi:hypothetical protein AVEN_128302-1 [Araneus ventricosus]|uniref:Uncharacterized protein n=1 Tax=Araneus ventricosus TaxID=182803 RepID=A0A4Y2P0R1_ARAVE|nr:hypothetical protein AVEN_128302-1 [Araneus ventricosus]
MEGCVDFNPAGSQHLRNGSRGSRMSIQPLKWPTGTSHMELWTVTVAPLCVYTRNVSREAHVPQSLRRSMHDGSSPYYTNDVREHLNIIYGKH